MSVAAIGIGARWSVVIPGAAAPQSAQTLLVLLVGAVLGPRWGPAAIAIYILAGVSGLPVFAGGRAGLGVLLGPSAGYLVGFVVAARWMGWFWALKRPPTRRGIFARSLEFFGAGLVAHAVILLAGGSWLAAGIDPAVAYSSGVAPFLWGAVVKSAVASLLVPISAFLRIGPESAFGGRW